jgi:soluble lytic murein transglycosylase-like protein
MIRTPFIAAPVASARPNSRAGQLAAGPAMLAGTPRAGAAGFSQILSEVLMTRQQSPQPATAGRRQEFPVPIRHLDNAYLSQMMTRSSLRISPGRGLSQAPATRSSRPSSGSEPERLFNSVKSRGRPVDPQVFDGMIKAAAACHQVPEELVKAVIKVESNFNPQATSHMGAMGLMQLMPGTARDLGVQRPYDPQENINGGTKYLRELLDRYDGNVPKAVAAYNCGMRNVERGILPAETRNYLQLVSKYYNGSQVLRKDKVTPPPVKKPAAPEAPVSKPPAPELFTTKT